MIYFGCVLYEMIQVPSVPRANNKAARLLRIKIFMNWFSKTICSQDTALWQCACSLFSIIEL